MIFFKRKTIVVDCFTDSVTAYTYQPIQRATKFFPEWFKEVPTFKKVPGPTNNMLVTRSSIKRCVGFTDLFKKGAVLPLWADLQIQTDNVGYEYVFAFAVDSVSAQHHDSWQYGPSFDNRIHMKIISPWAIEQNKYCQFLMNPLVWNTEPHWDNFTVLPGIMDFKHQHSSHINLFLHKNRKMFINAGTPMYHIIPLTEDNVEFRTHLVEKKDLDRLHAKNTGTFLDRYRSTKKADLKKEASKCPFGFK